MTTGTDISKLHEGTDGSYCENYIALGKPEILARKLMSTEWQHKGARLALTYSFQAANGRRTALSVFQRYTGFYGPRDGATNFKHAEKNTLWECKTRKTQTERCTWMNVRQTVEPKIDAI